MRNTVMGALSNIDQFFVHLKENIEALHHPSRSSDSEEFEETSSNEHAEDYYNQSELRDGTSKPAANRMQAVLHVDENFGRTSGNQQTLENKQNWKPHAAGHIHYYAPKPSFIDSEQNILRRANNYNQKWLYTNLGLGKRRR